MLREELRGHCERQIQQFERVEKIMPVTPNDWKRYEEHKLVLELLEQESILDKIKAEIKEWYWQVDKQALAKDPCVVDAMIDLFIRTIDKYKVESGE
jgi:hypothetical protein